MTTDTRFAESFSNESFWDKLLRFAKAAGREVVEVALQLYYTLQEPSTPLWAKGVIAVALGYFISPVDAVPDIIPVVGYSDDLGVLIAAIVTVATYISDGIKAKAAAQIGRWFD